MVKLFSSRESRALVVFLLLAGLLILGVLLVRQREEHRAAQRIETELETPQTPDSLFAFDPNTVEYADLRRLGLSSRQATNLVKYRASGKVFRIPEDVATCYGMTDSLYFALAPYIEIAPEFAIRPRPRTEYSREYPRREYSRPYRDSLRKPWDTLPKRPARKLPVELNTADSAALRSVSGIGEKSVTAILTYRRRLGGFHRVEQLAEIPQVTEANFERIVQQICCDSCKIQKIDINFAPPSALQGHPYLPPVVLRKLLSKRELKGGWSTTRELIEDHILTEEEAARLAPYLQFNK